jgi:hypothetical protein
MSTHTCILRHHKRPKNMWLYILNVCFTFFFAVMPQALHKHTYVLLADIYIMLLYCYVKYVVQYVGCFISGPTDVRTLVRSTFRMYVHSKCTR